MGEIRHNEELLVLERHLFLDPLLPGTVLTGIVGLSG